MRQKWIKYYMQRAASISTLSKDPQHKVGAAIVDKDNFLISEGYNGPPRFVQDTGLPREVEVLRTLHAEINAIILSRQSLKDTSIFVYPFLPCAQCAAAIIQVGITAVYYNTARAELRHWAWSQREALRMFDEAKVQVTQVRI